MSVTNNSVDDTQSFGRAGEMIAFYYLKQRYAEGGEGYQQYLEKSSGGKIEVQWRNEEEETGAP